MMWYEKISEGAHVGTTTHQGAPGGPGTPRRVVPTWCTSLSCYLHKKNLKYSEKNVLNFQGILRTFIFWVIFYCTRNSKTRQNMAFYFI